eukprot:scaffold43510_cov52-Attheya_sp.AAC.1
MGDVAQVRDGNKICPIFRYSPIIYFQPEDENAEQVEIPYPFGFKGDIPLLTEVAYDEARAAEQLDPVTDEQEDINTHVQDAIWNLVE